jgi:uncharacterized membrane protein
MSGNELVGAVRAVFEWASLVIEALGAAIIVAGVVKVVITRGTIRYLFKLGQPGAYESYKHQLGKTLLLGLELLVAADVVRTVALEPTLTNVAVLGLLVVIRTFLSWSLTVEIEGRWPWQARVENAKPDQPLSRVAVSATFFDRWLSRDPLAFIIRIVAGRPTHVAPVSTSRHGPANKLHPVGIDFLHLLNARLS